MIDFMFIILLIIIINFLILVGLYFGGLRNLTPTRGYLSFAFVIGVLVIADIWVYSGLSAHEKDGAKCPKDRIEVILNELSRGSSKSKSEILECAGGNGNISILVKDVAGNEKVQFSGKSKKIKLLEYINGLEKTALGNKITISEYRQDTQGQIVFLEIIENYN